MNHRIVFRYFKILVCTGIIWPGSTGCKNEVDDPGWINPMPSYSDSLVLTKIGKKEFRLDTATILKNENFQYLENENALLSYNSVNSELVCFDYASQKLNWKLDMTQLKILPRAKGTMKMYNFRVLSYDSIFFYDNDRKKIILFDTARTILKTYNVQSAVNNYTTGSPSSGEELIVGRDSLFVTSAPGGRNTSKQHSPRLENIILSISIKDGGTRPVMRYPDIYGKATWGHYFHTFHTTYNETGDKFLISFPIDHDIQVYNAGKKSERYYAGSIHVPRIDPLIFPGGNGTIKSEEEIINFISQRKYQAIKYDRYRNVYYRFVSPFVLKKDFEKSKSPQYKSEPISVIILDGSLKKVGEISLDANIYSGFSMFISKDGLCIPLKKSNDETIYFDIYTITKK